MDLLPFFFLYLPLCSVAISSSSSSSLPFLWGNFTLFIFPDLIQLDTRTLSLLVLLLLLSWFLFPFTASTHHVIPFPPSLPSLVSFHLAPPRPTPSLSLLPPTLAYVIFPFFPPFYLCFLLFPLFLSSFLLPFSSHFAFPSLRLSLVHRFSSSPPCSYTLFALFLPPCDSFSPSLLFSP